MNLKEFRERQKELAKLLVERVDRVALKTFLIFSYLGARVCYAETHPLLLFDEERFKDFERFKSFLLHLKKAGHFSVFAHTPLFVNLEDLSLDQKLALAQNFHKVFWDEEKKLALFNLRHLAETLPDQEFLYLINQEPDLTEIEVILTKNYQITYRGKLSELDSSYLTEKDSIFAEPEIILLRSFKEYPFKWVAVVTHHFSRIFSHQYVRHTWLNFNQRSHRYTKVDKFVIPKAFKENDVKKYYEVIQKGLEIYRELTKNIKKESARFVVPQGVATTLLATGPELVWQDFIEKRAIPQAQEEIRDFAVFLKELLEMGL